MLRLLSSLWGRVPKPWSPRIVSVEMMLVGGKLWVRQLTRGPLAGAWQFPPELCAPGKVPPAPYRTPSVSVSYITRRGKRQSALAVAAVRRIRSRWACVPFAHLTLYVLDVAFSDPIGDENGEAVYAGVSIPCGDPADPVQSLLRWTARARLTHPLG